jgi:hypothetical protein
MARLFTVLLTHRGTVLARRSPAVHARRGKVFLISHAYRASLPLGGSYVPLPWC